MKFKGGCKMKTKKLVGVKLVGKQKRDKKHFKNLVGVLKYVKGKESLKRIEGKVLAIIGKLVKFPKVIGKLPIKLSSQVIPIVQLQVLGEFKKGKKVQVQKLCKEKLGIVRDNFSLRLLNTFKAFNTLKISSLKIERKNCLFVENSKNRILEFTLS
jgi:hypothetical protein